MWLTTGRRLPQYHTRTQTRRAAGIDYLLSEETLEVHPEDIARVGLEDGGWAEVSNPRGCLHVKVRATTARNPACLRVGGAELHGEPQDASLCFRYLRGGGAAGVGE